MPDEIIVPGVPHTRTGKRLEVPLKRLFQGVDSARAVNPGAVDDASLVEHYVRLAKDRAAADRRRLASWVLRRAPREEPCSPTPMPTPCSPAKDGDCARAFYRDVLGLTLVTGPYSTTRSPPPGRAPRCW